MGQKQKLQRWTGVLQIRARHYSAGSVLVAICGDVLVLVSEMGRQQLLYIMMKYEATNC